MKCGLLGERLGHSYSKVIHEKLGGYEYNMYECAPDELESFLTRREFDALNVTIPYKKAVIPYCAELSATACDIGSVNTIIKRADGSLYGDNTDAYGFADMVKKSGISIVGKKAVVLGSGGASATICAVLKRLGAKSVTIISRSGADNYSNLEKHCDAEVIVNTTPVGMYPNNGNAAVDLSMFPHCAGVLDIVYNPMRTALLLQAERLSIPHMGGLNMLVAQAKRAAELFMGTEIANQRIDEIEHELAVSMQNIVLVGMPGCGKSTVACALGERLGRTVIDSDAEIERKVGMSIPKFFEKYGENAFRDIESDTLRELGSRSNSIISTGGGSVLRNKNYEYLHQNGTIFYIKRDTDKLSRDGRPISLKSDLNVLFSERKARYEAFADRIADNNGSLEQTLQTILEGII